MLRVMVYTLVLRVLYTGGSSKIYSKTKKVALLNQKSNSKNTDIYDSNIKLEIAR